MANADALGFAGNKGEHGFRRRHVRVVAQCGVLHAPEGVETELVGQHRLLDGVIEDLAVAFATGVHRLCFVNQ
ncbi:hypothetical protein D3C80_1764330 [compost metagenome]